MSQNPSRKKILVLIDGHALIYRAYYAFKPLLTNKDGVLVNAVYGFTRILLSALKNLSSDYIAVVFDHPKPTFRHEQFKDYKAHRAKMPDDLRPQVEIIKQIVQALNIPQFEVAGYEADDLIGSLSRQAIELNSRSKRKNKLKTVIVTGDMDFFQLVDQSVKVWLPGRGRGQMDTEYDAMAVKEKTGVTPEQIVDLKALMGDSSDNIPGIRGIGPKTATKLIQEFDDLDGVYKVVEKIVADDSLRAKLDKKDLLKGAVFKKLVEGKEAAYLSQKLATIDRQAPIKFKLQDCLVRGYDKQKTVDLLLEYDFKSLVPMLPEDEFEAGVQSALF